MTEETTPTEEEQNERFDNGLVSEKELKQEEGLK